MDQGFSPKVAPSHNAFALDELATRHKEFLSLSWQGRSPAEVGERFTQAYGQVPLVVMATKGPELGCSTLHRARWVDPKQEDLSHSDTYCYPRSPEKQMMGRANLPGIPVFYTCGTTTNSLKEARSGKGDDPLLMHSEWRFNDARPWQVATMISPDHSVNNNIIFHEEWERALREYILNSGHLPQEYLIALYRSVAELFLMENYEVTSWIAHQILQEQGAADVLIYPSLMARELEFCHAFRTPPIDEGRVMLHRVEQIRQSPGGFFVVREGHAEGTYIRWGEPSNLPLHGNG